MRQLPHGDLLHIALPPPTMMLLRRSRSSMSYRYFNEGRLASLTFEVRGCKQYNDQSRGWHKERNGPSNLG
jgi:hypothetical protein